MTKKDRPVAHKGTRSWWDGSLKTDCGQKLPQGTFKRPGWGDPKPEQCPGCFGEGAHKH